MTVERQEYDVYERVVAALDALDRETSIAYSPAIGGPVRAVTTTNVPVQDTAPAEVRLFEAPSGWEVTQAGDLSQLVGGVAYWVDFETTGYQVKRGTTRARHAEIDFMLEDLLQLDGGDVLMATDDLEGQVVSVEEFEQAGDKLC